MNKNKYAIVRLPSESLVKAISGKDMAKHIDIEKAFYQHSKYCEVFLSLGLTVIALPSDPLFPDSCFVQDPFVVFGDKALITHMAAKSRRGEGKAMAEVIKHFKNIHSMDKNGTLDGGDVMVTPQKIFIGQSKRTNLVGIEKFKQVFYDENLPEIIVIPVEKCLHLMTGVTYVGKNTLLLSSLIDDSYFENFQKIYVPDKESYAANCLLVGQTVLVPKGYRFVKRKLVELGFEVVELDMSEFEKADGGVTCLSIIF